MVERNPTDVDIVLGSKDSDSFLITNGFSQLCHTRYTRFQNRLGPSARRILKTLVLTSIVLELFYLLASLFFSYANPVRGFLQKMSLTIADMYCSILVY
jgi:hypothetical protein